MAVRREDWRRVSCCSPGGAFSPGGVEEQQVADGRSPKDDGGVGATFRKGTEDVKSTASRSSVYLIETLFFKFYLLLIQYFIVGMICRCHRPCARYLSHSRCPIRHLLFKRRDKTDTNRTYGSSRNLLHVRVAPWQAAFLHSAQPPSPTPYWPMAASLHPNPSTRDTQRGAP
ncbi:hypothetical protein BU26DRAFT_180410 [Trematosphaeria pertusa]|uniref:Uncharacterized protein n=1 Tax=Trematosphaeria pertusa TaxID=390896 RepID=A0A6A6HUJ8_9PLEO|nr:uncharacterized protein BU26DRAFT_180410 [Trematosphaeria pertusa]KAF2241110.1 hypothetical protein BU26DRAFT_180410 [Trematosphaeria pertusa]